MRHRLERYRCHYATEFRVDSVLRGGTILDVSRSGVLAFAGPCMRRGQRLTFGLNGVERRATVVRFDRHGNVGLRLERPLCAQDLRIVFHRPKRGRR